MMPEGMETFQKKTPVDSSTGVSYYNLATWKGMQLTLMTGCIITCRVTAVMSAKAGGAHHTSVCMRKLTNLVFSSHFQSIH